MKKKFPPGTDRLQNDHTAFGYTVFDEGQMLRLSPINPEWTINEEGNTKELTKPGNIVFFFNRNKYLNAAVF